MRTLSERSVVSRRSVVAGTLAAPLILIEEAGGRLTDFKGKRTYAGGNAVASNGLVHDAILEKLNRA